MSQPRRLRGFGLFMLLIPILLVSCIKSTEAQPNRPAQDAPTTFRTNCDEISGTAFRGAEEREWYMQNCSRWPLLDLPVAQPGSARGNQLPPECAAQRGRPYQSNEQRQWYLQNCLGNPAQAAPPSQPTPGPPNQPPQNQQPQQASAAAGPDRTNCNEIRGTPYRSAAERSWYAANCSGTQAQPVVAGPDRTNCDEIRGTPYRSAGERSWYAANCSGNQPNQSQPLAAGPDRTNCDEIRGSAYRSAGERQWYLDNCPR